MNMIGSKLFMLLLVLFVVLTQGYQIEFNNLKNDGSLKKPNNLNLTGKSSKRISNEVSKQIKVMELNNNSLTSIEFDDFQDLTSLEILNLGSNDLVHISPGAFKELRYLQVLNLRSNRLADLKAHHFDGLFRLRFLDLGENPLVRLEVTVFEGLMQLESLRLDGCNLISFHMASVTNLLFLDYLDLSRNYLTSLQVQKSQRSYPSSLRVLRLSENPWNCDCRLKNVVSQLSSLEYVRWSFEDSIPICCEPSQLAKKQWTDLPIDNFVCSSNSSNIKQSEDMDSLIQKTFTCFKPEILKIDSNTSIIDIDPDQYETNYENILSIIIPAIILMELIIIFALVAFAINIYRKNNSTDGYVNIIT